MPWRAGQMREDIAGPPHTAVAPPRPIPQAPVHVRGPCARSLTPGKAAPSALEPLASEQLREVPLPGVLKSPSLLRLPGSSGSASHTHDRAGTRDSNGVCFSRERTPSVFCVALLKGLVSFTLYIGMRL